MAHLFKITNRKSGLVLGVFQGKDEQDALDNLARDAGYHDHAHACEVAPVDDGELLVECVDPEEILAHLSEADLEDLEAWRYLENVDSAHLGGRGRTDAQMDAADRAWDALSPNAQTAFIVMRRSVVDDLIAAIRDVGIPDTDRDIDAITALLGHDHHAFRIMPAYALVDAYAEAMEQTGN